MSYKTRHLLVLIPLSCCSLIILLGLFMQFKVFSVKAINCQVSGQNPCPDQILQPLKSAYLNQSIFSPKLKAINPDIQAHIKGFDLTYSDLSLKGHLDLAFTPKPPIISLSDPVTNTWILIANDGTLVSQSSEVQPGTITIDYAPTYNQENSMPGAQFTRLIAELVTSLSNKGVPISHIKLYQNSILAGDLPDQKKAIFTLTKPIDRQVASLHLILSKATIDQETPVIDLRFDKPVLRKTIPVQSTINLHEKQ